MANCIDCEKHAVINDRDPDDWFCDDDVAIVCTLTPNPTRDTSSKWLSDHSEFRAVERSIRPYNVRKESDTPDWCPLKRQS